MSGAARMRLPHRVPAALGLGASTAFGTGYLFMGPRRTAPCIHSILLYSSHREPPVSTTEYMKDSVQNMVGRGVYIRSVSQPSSAIAVVSVEK